MKIAFISSGQYPNGGAAANRHIAYAKGLVELGHEVLFILLAKQNWSEGRRIEDGIEFKCVDDQGKEKNYLIGKLRSYLNRLATIRKMISMENEARAISIFILLDTDIQVLIPLMKHVRKLGGKIFHERTEYPFVVGTQTIREKIKRFFYLRFVVRRFDGIFVINHALEKYFFRKTGGRIPIVIINMIVDPARFQCKPIMQRSERMISYCGSMGGDKDGVPILIEAFAMMSNKFPNVKLRLIGSFDNDSTRNRIESLIRAKSIKDKVIITGRIDRDKIPGLLCESEILALARPNNKQAEGGFPTKLGEYLATGNAVVITNVGEVNLFLKDGHNAFIAEPDSAVKFSEKLMEALRSERREQIGAEGKKLVQNEFNYLTQAKVMEKAFIGS